VDTGYSMQMPPMPPAGRPGPGRRDPERKPPGDRPERPRPPVREGATIDIVGFSRGAATAVHFANVIAAPALALHDNPCQRAAQFHAMALDEVRGTFALIRPTRVDRDPDCHDELWFRGVHSNIGGGYADRFCPTSRSDG
jgi:hypothetical protein